jgi:pentatricopeptide repeat protein
VRGYGVCGRPEKAREWFNKAKQKDIILYNAMLQTYIDSEMWGGVHEIFGMMLADPNKIAPTIITYKMFFKALLSQEKFEEAKKLFYDSIAKYQWLEFGQIKEILKWLSKVQPATEALKKFNAEVVMLAQRRFPKEFEEITEYNRIFKGGLEKN